MILKGICGRLLKLMGAVDGVFGVEWGANAEGEDDYAVARRIGGGSRQRLMRKGMRMMRRMRRMRMMRRIRGEDGLGMLRLVPQRLRGLPHCHKLVFRIRESIRGIITSMCPTCWSVLAFLRARRGVGCRRIFRRGIRRHGRYSTCRRRLTTRSSSFMSSGGMEILLR